MIAKGKWNNSDFPTDLEKSIQDVASQVKGLCDYLQELGVN